MIGIITFMTVLVVSLVVVKIAGIALMLTGLSSEIATFQARSAWTGTGFPSADSERIVAHPVRRRIISLLMVVRGAGFVTAIAALVISFAGMESGFQSTERLAILFIGIAAIWLLSVNDHVNRFLSRIIRWLLSRYTDLEVRDYAELLHLADNYAITEMQIEPDDWIANRTLFNLALPQEGILVLGLKRQGVGFLGAPDGETFLKAGDVVILYGRAEQLAALDRRKAGPEGDAARKQAVETHRQVLELQHHRTMRVPD